MEVQDWVKDRSARPLAVGNLLLRHRKHYPVIELRADWSVLTVVIDVVTYTVTAPCEVRVDLKGLADVIAVFVAVDGLYRGGNGKRINGRLALPSKGFVVVDGVRMGPEAAFRLLVTPA